MSLRLRNILALILIGGFGVFTVADRTTHAQIDDYPGDRAYCTGTATAMFESCRSSGEPEYWKAVAICANISDNAARAECFDEATAARRENAQSCADLLEARREVCDAVGEERYEPAFEPHLFDSDFARLTRPNRYYPIAVGNRWDYRGGGEAITVVMLNKTKLIEGVTCLVVNDKVTRNGELIEDTDDWIAQARDGDVYYCGERVQDFETFPGDTPREAEMVSIDGSFKVGRGGDKSGILFRLAPRLGELYRQEFSLGNAEDVSEVLSTSYAFGRDPDLDYLVPKALADLLCAGDCIVTKDYTPHDPDAIEYKYYAPRIGKFLEVKLENGTVMRLVGCNVDSRCNVLAAQ